MKFLSWLEVKFNKSYWQNIYQYQIRVSELQIWIRFVRQRFDPTFETKGFQSFQKKKMKNYPDSSQCQNQLLLLARKKKLEEL